MVYRTDCDLFNGTRGQADVEKSVNRALDAEPTDDIKRPQGLGLLSQDRLGYAAVINHPQISVA